MKTHGVAISALGSFVIILAGCASDQGNVSYDAISGDLTPELEGTATRPVDMDRNIAYTADTNGRSFWDDVTRMFYVDHPSRLSPFPIVATSGQPR